ncbi:MAG TPA: hypothetical protein DD670_19205 [Planctomycetaceae bacterium]|nr:hypothetical protein [Planctomycetaceae bacterium]
METLTAAFTGTLLAVFLGYLAFSYRARGRREAGSLLLVLPRPGTRLGRILLLAAAILVVLGSAWFVVHAKTRYLSDLVVPNDAAFLPHVAIDTDVLETSGPVLAFLVTFVMTGLILAGWLWTRDLDLRESGIVLSDGLFHFWPWSLVKYCRWLDGDTLSITTPEWSYRVRVARDDIDAVNHILTPRVELRDRDSNVLNANEMRAPGSPRTTIDTSNRPLQFSVTTLLLFIIVASSVFAWLGTHLQGREQAALRDLRRFTDSVTMNGRNERTLDLRDDLDAWIVDDDMRHVTVCSRLEILSIKSYCLTDKGVERLVALRHLTELNLECPLVTDASVEHLATMKNIESLSLSKCKITDAGLKHLGSMQQLRSLHFSSDRVTDTGLRHLESLSQLETLRFKADRVTSVGLKRLRAALPNTEVQRYR